MPAVKEILAHYDKGKKQKLTAEEIGFPKDLFEKLDTAHAGSLSPRKLARWVIFDPDAELVVHWAETPAARTSKVLPPRTRRPSRRSRHRKPAKTCWLSLSILSR